MSGGILDRSDPVNESIVRPSQRLLNLLDAMAGPPGSLSDVGERHTGRMVASSSIVVFAAATMLMFWGFLAGSHGSTLALIFATGSLGAIPLLLLWTARLRWLAPHVITTSLFAICGTFAVVSAGDAVGAMVTLFAVPVLASSLSGPVIGAFWLAGVFVVYGMAATAAHLGCAPIVELTPLMWEEARFGVLGCVAGFVGGSVITSEWLRQRSAMEAQEARAALRESNRRYRALAEHAGDVVAEIDAELRIAFVSPNVASIVGVAPSEWLGREATGILIPEEAAPRVREAIASVGQQERSGPVMQFRFDTVHAEGHPIVLECSAKAFVDPSRGPRMVVIGRDVTLMHRAERALRRSERLASLGTLSAGIAHQINNPIGAILAAAEVGRLELADGRSENLGQVLADIGKDARRCGEIVRNLLRFGRDDDGEREVRDLREVVERAVELTRGHAAGRRVDLRLDCGGEALPIAMNVIEVEQVVLNVLRNACEARPRSGVVSVCVDRAGDRGRLEVSDDGLGMSPETSSRIFDPFFTTRGREGGTGLGLSVAHGIVEDHGGRILVDSVLEKGTTIVVEWPLDDA